MREVRQGALSIVDVLRQALADAGAEADPVLLQRLADLEALADVVVEQSGDAGVAALLRPRLPGVLEALVQGASLRGSQGAADRAMLFRLLRHGAAASAGGPGVGGMATARQLGQGIGDGMADALARRQAAAARVAPGPGEAIAAEMREAAAVVVVVEGE